MSVEKTLLSLRNKLEPVFYAVSKYLDKDQAEQLTVDIYEIILNHRIQETSDRITFVDSLIKNHVRDELHKQYKKGFICAQEGRMLTLQSEKESFTDQIHLLKLL